MDKIGEFISNLVILFIIAGVLLIPYFIGYDQGKKAKITKYDCSIYKYHAEVKPCMTKGCSGFVCAIKEN